ncbi:MAG: SMI1/KNR4 family protein [Saprospiraceae bacterium]|nr:SMI1/KNR4 family protein [Saprospiraceae bacterium]
MKFEDTIYESEDISDRATFDLLPSELKELYLGINGVVAFNGGLYLRGCVIEPKWLSLWEIWKGDTALSKIYEHIDQADIPFAQDAFGDQFIWRAGQIYRLMMETGDLENLNLSLNDFFDEIFTDPVKFLILEPLRELGRRGIVLVPGELMNVYPPFMFKFEGERSFKPVSSVEQIEYLQSIYIQTRNLSDGQKVRFKFDDKR